MTLLTADDVLNKKFQATKFREGYEQVVTSVSLRKMSRSPVQPVTHMDRVPELEVQATLDAPPHVTVRYR